MEVSQLERWVTKTPDVCSGDACIANSRIMVWLLVAFKKGGMSDEDLLRGYPTLNAEKLAAAWEYYRHYPQEIEAAIARHENEEEPPED